MNLIQTAQHLLLNVGPACFSVTSWASEMVLLGLFIQYDVNNDSQLSVLPPPSIMSSWNWPSQWTRDLILTLLESEETHSILESVKEHKPWETNKASSKVSGLIIVNSETAFREHVLAFFACNVLTPSWISVLWEPYSVPSASSQKCKSHWQQWVPISRYWFLYSHRSAPNTTNLCGSWKMLLQMILLLLKGYSQ